MMWMVRLWGKPYGKQAETMEAFIIGRNIYSGSMVSAGGFGGTWLIQIAAYKGSPAAAMRNMLQPPHWWQGRYGAAV